VDATTYFYVGRAKHLARAKKMVNLSIEETSGVDHPAHLHEGWLVMKSADTTDVQRVLDESLNREDSLMEKTAEEQVVETTPEEIKAEEVVAEVTEEVAEVVAEEVKEESSEEEILKSAPESVIKMVEDLRKAKAFAEEKANEFAFELQKQRDAKADAEAVAKASAWTHLNLDAQKVGKALRLLTEKDAELAKSVEDVLSSVNAQAESANIFAEIGKSVEPQMDDAYGRMAVIAKSLVEKGEVSSIEAGIAKVAVSSPDLYSQYLTEKGAK
jgi:hypothetical protein